MPGIQATTSGGTITVSNIRVTTPSIQNVTITVANEEQAINLPNNTVRFRIQVRGTASLKLAYTATESATNYITVWPGAYYIEEQINRTNTTLYVQSPTAGEVVEIVTWL